MIEQTFNFWDIAIVTIVIAGAGYYMYRKLFKKKNMCGGGCDSCVSNSARKNAKR